MSCNCPVCNGYSCDPEAKCLYEQISLLTRRLAILQKGLEEIANNHVVGPSAIGPLHGVGMAEGIYIQARIATKTLKEAEEIK